MDIVKFTEKFNTIVKKAEQVCDALDEAIKNHEWETVGRLERKSNEYVHILWRLERYAEDNTTREEWIYFYDNANR